MKRKKGENQGQEDGTRMRRVKANDQTNKEHKRPGYAKIYYLNLYTKSWNLHNQVESVGK